MSRTQDCSLITLPSSYFILCKVSTRGIRHAAYTEDLHHYTWEIKEACCLCAQTECHGTMS